MKDYFADPYVRRARLEPALLVALPAALAVFAWFPSDWAGAGAVWSLVVWSGGTALIAQVARGAGKAREPQLFRLWGGKPTTRLLRHRDSSNPVLLRRRHDKVRALLPSVHIPSATEEAADRGTADAVYEACTVFLLEKTRSRERFPLVFEANCDYGFRRNFWGMKPLAIPLALASAAATSALIFENIAAGSWPEPVPVASAIVVLALIVGWVGWFNTEWVKVSADAFAERLLGSMENL